MHTNGLVVHRELFTKRWLLTLLSRAQQNKDFSTDLDADAGSLKQIQTFKPKKDKKSSS
jgi:hypothetical protein